MACIGVILMHCGFPEFAGKFVSYTFKFNVPVFFMISGYFLYTTDSHKITRRLAKRIRSILLLLLAAFLLYGAWSFFQNCVLGQMELPAWLAASFPFAQLAHKLVFGTFFCGPMWYLYAAFWGYVVLYILSYRIRLDRMFPVAALLLVLHIVVRALNKMIWPDTYDVTYYRSFLLYAIPFMILGVCLAKHRKTVVHKLTTRSLILLALFGCALQFAEYALTHQSLDFYFGSILYATSVFLLALKYPEIGKSGVASVLRYIGQNLSMFIYLVHILCIEGTSSLLAPIVPKVIFEWLHPLIAIFSSVAVAYIAFSIKRMARHCKKCS